MARHDLPPANDMGSERLPSGPLTRRHAEMVRHKQREADKTTVIHHLALNPELDHKILASLLHEPDRLSEILENLPEPSAEAWAVVHAMRKAIDQGESPMNAIDNAFEKASKLRENTPEVIIKKVVGQVLEIIPVPGARNMWRATVDIGEEEPITINCGGIDVLRPGHKITVALQGASLSDGKKLRKRNYNILDPRTRETTRETSYGMALSSKEAGFPPFEADHQVAILVGSNEHPLEPGTNLDTLIRNPDGTLSTYVTNTRTFPFRGLPPEYL